MKIKINPKPEKCVFEKALARFELYVGKATGRSGLEGTRQRC